MKVHPKIIKLLSGPFCREDLLALLPLASNADHRRGLYRLAMMTTTREDSRRLTRALRIS